MGIFAECICPSCFNEINLGECRILSGRTSGKILKNPSKSIFGRMRVEPLDGPFYTTELARRECYVCQYLLPSNIEKVPSIMLVVVGDVSSGKSTYLASFIHQLRTQWLNNASGFATFRCLTPDVQQDYITNYFEPLFTYKKGLAPSQPGTSPYARPLIYELSLSHSPKRPITVVNLLLYDTSGEDYQAEDRLVNFARFVLNTDALIFVVNPVVIPDVFHQLDPALKTPYLQAQFAGSQSSRPAERLSAILSIYERYHGYPKGARLADTPVAVMVSKSDLLSKGSTIKSPQYYGGGVDLQDIEAVNWEMRDLLQRHYGQGDLVAATNRLTLAKFFATSATGEAPDVSNNFVDVRPLRCLDPVLWILHELSIIKNI